MRIGEPVEPKTDVAESSGNLLANNYIHDGGLVYSGAVGVWIAQSSGNTIAHNEIHSFNYTGISVGWNWGYIPNRTHHNRIEYNHVHHVLRGMHSDGGGIYTLGPQPGTVIRNNVFHDIFPYRGEPTMAWGIYFDEGSSQMLVENNIVYNTLTGGLMSPYAPGNVIRNNIFALSAWQAVWRWFWLRNPPSHVEHNIFYLTQGDLFHNDAGPRDFKSKWDYNTYWRTDGRPLLFYDYDFAEWQAKGMDRHGQVADPGFADPAGGDFSLKPDSPAVKLGFHPIDRREIGLQGPPEWVNLPKQAVFPPTMLPKGISQWDPATTDDGFETTAEGQKPGGAIVYEEGRGDTVRVTAETAASGKHSLKITDAPGLEARFNPHFFYTPHFRQGLARLSFDIRVEKGAIVGHQWRDAEEPFRVGPSIQIDAQSRLFAEQRQLLDVPAGKWIHVEIACGLGKEANGTYDLSVTLPGQSPRVFPKLPCVSPEFRRLEWLGFVSLATEKTMFYLDNVRLSAVDFPVDHKRLSRRDADGRPSKGSS